MSSHVGRSSRSPKRRRRRTRAFSRSSSTIWSIASSFFSRRAASSRSQAASDFSMCSIEGSRRARIAAGRPRVGRERPQPEVGAFAFLHRAWGLCGSLEPLSGLTVVAVPVMHEADVMQILPAVRLRGHGLAEQTDRQIRSPGSTRLFLREKECAEPVGDAEIRIEGRGQIEQRVQQVVRPVGPIRQARSAVMLNGADPIQIRHDGVV